MCVPKIDFRQLVRFGRFTRSRRDDFTPQSPLLRRGFAHGGSFVPPLFGQLLSGRFGMSQTLEAEFAHPHLVDGLIWPSPFVTRLAKDSADGIFPCGFHTHKSIGSASSR